MIQFHIWSKFFLEGKDCKKLKEYKKKIKRGKMQYLAYISLINNVNKLVRVNTIMYYVFSFEIKLYLKHAKPEMGLQWVISVTCILTPG